MNIWIFNHYAIGPNSSGGTRHYDLSKQLVRLGHNVTIFASSFNHQTFQEEHIFDNKVKFVSDTSEGVRFFWIKSTSYKQNNYKRVLNMLSYSFRAHKIAKKIDEKPDVVVGSLVHPFAAYVGYLVAKHYGCKFYFEERDLWPQTLIDLGKIPVNHPSVKLLRRLERFLYQKADKIIVLFDKAIDYVEQQGIDRNKVICIPNGADLERYESKSSTNVFKEQFNLFNELKGKFIAVYTGAHGLANNLDSVLDAAILLKENKNIHFLLIGDGPEKLRLMERAKSERIDNVTFLNPISKEEIPYILKNVNVGLLPLKNSVVFKWGISPNKMFDYMAASLPVIVLCDLEDTPIEKANGGFVIKGDFSSELAKKIKSLYQNENLCVNMGENGYDYLVKYHSWEKLAKDIDNIL